MVGNLYPGVEAAGFVMTLQQNPLHSVGVGDVRQVYTSSCVAGCGRIASPPRNYHIPLSLSLPSSFPPTAYIRMYTNVGGGH